MQTRGLWGQSGRGWQWADIATSETATSERLRLLTAIGFFVTKFTRCEISQLGIGEVGTVKQPSGSVCEPIRHK